MGKNIFKHTVLSGKPCIGGWSMSASETVVEAMATLSYDYVVLDVEHAPLGMESVGGLLRALAVHNMPAVVRMVGHSPTDIKQVLDRGAMSLLFPFVQTAAQAKQIVTACKYPPLGNRGFAFMVRGSGYTSNTDYVSQFNDQVFLAMQLETPEALDNAASIARVQGVDSVFIGPGDLSMSMGRPGDITHPEVRSAIEKCVAKMHTIGVKVGTISPHPEYAKWAFDVGFSYVSISNDLALIVKGGQQKIDTVRQGLSPHPQGDNR